MADLINGRTAEEIKKGLRHCQTVCLEDCPYYRTGIKCSECTVYLSRDALALIQHLEAKVPKWISVEERLPVSYGTYLTTIRCPKGSWIETNIYERREERWEHDCGYHTEDVTEWITHWMPLPEPPKEEKT